MGFISTSLSRIVGEFNKRWKALRRSVGYSVLLVVLFTFLFLDVNTELRGLGSRAQTET